MGRIGRLLEYKEFVEFIYGKLIADKGYISKNLFQRLFVDGIQLITKLKSNMKGALMSVSDKLLLRKRAIIETVNDELKNIAQVEHSRHRCFDNFIVNMLGLSPLIVCFQRNPASMCNVHWILNFHCFEFVELTLHLDKKFIQMNSSQRVFINTLAQYLRTIFNMVLSLYTIRLVLSTLGQTDFGIYSLIAGVVAMLSFITNSLVTTTQRFVSYYQGKSDMQKVKEVFNDCLLIHIILGGLLSTALLFIAPLLFDEVLNIPIERIGVARTVYNIVVIILLTTFVAAPFRALLISRENIVYISFVEVLDGVLKLILVVLMTTVKYDKLEFYAFIMLLIQLFNIVMLSSYCYRKYEECVVPKIQKLQWKNVRRLTVFASWSIYGTCCTIGRQQGIALLLNRLSGPVINAAYGVGFQIAGYTNFLATSLVNAISPQIIKSEGDNDRERALWLSNVASKFIFFFLSIICVPCMFEIDNILKWWLKEVPEHANLFCIMVMCTLLADAVSIGLAYINQAIGHIGMYTFVLSTPKLFTLPIVAILMTNGYALEYIAVAYVTIEFMCACARIFFIKRTAGLSISRFLTEVVGREFFPFIICVMVCWLCVNLFDFKYRFVLTFAIASPLYAFSFYKLGLTKREYNVINNIIQTIIIKLKR